MQVRKSDLFSIYFVPMENTSHIQIYVITFRNPKLITVAALRCDAVNFTQGLRNLMGPT
jgi:hypothetical protein